MTERLMVLANVGTAEEPQYEEAHIKGINEEGHAVVAFADGDEAIYVNQYHPAGIMPAGTPVETAAAMTPEAKLKKAQGQLKLRTSMDKAHELQAKWKGKRGDEAKAGRDKAKDAMDKVHAAMKKNGWTSLPSAKALTNAIARLSESGTGAKNTKLPPGGNKPAKSAGTTELSPERKKQLNQKIKMKKANLDFATGRGDTKNAKRFAAELQALKDELSGKTPPKAYVPPKVKDPKAEQKSKDAARRREGKAAQKSKTAYLYNQSLDKG